MHSLTGLRTKLTLAFGVLLALALAAPAHAIEVYGPCDTYVYGDVSTNPPDVDYGANLGCWQ